MLAKNRRAPTQKGTHRLRIDDLHKIDFSRLLRRDVADSCDITHSKRKGIVAEKSDVDEEFERSTSVVADADEHVRRLESDFVGVGAGFEARKLELLDEEREFRCNERLKDFDRYHVTPQNA